MTKKIMTVTGPIAPSDLGICLTHEHLAIDGAPMCRCPSDPQAAEMFESEMRAELNGRLRRNPTSVRSNTFLEDDEVAEDLADYRGLGGRSLVEVTPVGLGRDPRRLKALSETTGLRIVAGSAHYIAALQPAWVHDASVEKIADWFRAEVTDGIDGTGIRPGILGELGISMVLEPSEEKVLRAAARVHTETGLAISLHVFPAPVAARALDVLEEEGADLTRVVVGHCDAGLDVEGALDQHKKLARRGCFVAYDTFGGDVRMPPSPLNSVPMWGPGDSQRIKALMALIESGLSSQLLISQDTCMKMHLLKYGGRGYGELLRIIVPDLLAFGVPPSCMDQILIDNPRRLLAF